MSSRHVRVSRCVLLLFAGSSCLWPEDPEAGIIKLGRTERMLQIESGRPLDSAAYLLASAYQIDVSAEDPPFACAEDVVDSHPSRTFPLAAEHAYLPKGSSFEVRFSVNEKRYPPDSKVLLEKVVAAFNAHSTFRYRLNESGDVFAFVPVVARDAKCRPAAIRDLLDSVVTVPGREMHMYEAVRAMEAELSEAAGERVNLGAQEWLNGILDLKVRFATTTGPARDLLLSMIKATHYRFYWLMREQPIRGGWAINLIPLQSRSGRTLPHPRILWPGQQPLPPWRPE